MQRKINLQELERQAHTNSISSQQIVMDLIDVVNQKVQEIEGLKAKIDQLEKQ